MVTRQSRIIFYFQIQFWDKNKSWRHSQISSADNEWATIGPLSSSGTSLVTSSLNIHYTSIGMSSHFLVRDQKISNCGIIRCIEAGWSSSLVLTMNLTIFSLLPYCCDDWSVQTYMPGVMMLYFPHLLLIYIHMCFHCGWILCNLCSILHLCYRLSLPPNLSQTLKLINDQLMAVLIIAGWHFVKCFQLFAKLFTQKMKCLSVSIWS